LTTPWCCEEELERARRVAIVGMGFIGLEVASACRSRSVDVVAVECAARSAGSDRRTGGRRNARGDACRPWRGCANGVTVTDIYGESRVAGIVLSDGSRVDADVVVVGIGVVPTRIGSRAAA
jgi:3-phenylpropionate/trans-cinnamate dioxygenase ferredoxin reductase subunit